MDAAVQAGADGNEAGVRPCRYAHGARQEILTIEGLARDDGNGAPGPAHAVRVPSPIQKAERISTADATREMSNQRTSPIQHARVASTTRQLSIEAQSAGVSPRT